jgi:hypothetical protein
MLLDSNKWKVKIKILARNKPEVTSLVSNIHPIQ